VGWAEVDPVIPQTRYRKPGDGIFPLNDKTVTLFYIIVPGGKTLEGVECLPASVHPLFFHAVAAWAARKL